jgi:hypothetical protein
MQGIRGQGGGGNPGASGGLAGPKCHGIKARTLLPVSHALNGENPNTHKRGNHSGWKYENIINPF